MLLTEEVDVIAGKLFPLVAGAPPEAVGVHLHVGRGQMGLAAIDRLVAGVAEDVPQGVPENSGVASRTPPSSFFSTPMRLGSTPVIMLKREAADGIGAIGPLEPHAGGR